MSNRDRFGCTACDRTFQTDLEALNHVSQEHEDAQFYDLTDRIAAERETLDQLRELAAVDGGETR